MTEMRRFATRRAEPIVIWIDDEKFTCHGAMPLGAADDMAEMTSLASRIAEFVGQDEQDIPPEAAVWQADYMKALSRFFDAVLLPESAKRFADRIRDVERPIDLETAQEVYQSLVEAYGGRPTMPPEPSSNGLGGTGTSSTDGASPTASTSDASEDSGSIDYSTSSTGG